jgi:glutaminyl-peptide cyclotransferase
MAKKQARKHRPAPAQNRHLVSGRSLAVIAALIAVLGLGGFMLVRLGGDRHEATATDRAPGRPAPAARADYEVVASYPHDPNAFLQGLLWYEGGFYESTGLEGQSTLRRVDISSGKVLKSIDLAPDLFGEGLALAGDRLVQLTWKSKRGFVYDRDTFNLLREFSFDTEGWGITYDGSFLIMSDGSDTLTYLDPRTFEPVKKLKVTLNGQPVYELNELEFVEGEIWSNVWQTDYIMRIDPATGRVTSFLDMKGLLPVQARRGNEDVLNGIAYDPAGKRIFVSGKMWPRVFEIRLK